MALKRFRGPRILLVYHVVACIFFGLGRVGEDVNWIKIYGRGMSFAAFFPSKTLNFRRCSSSFIGFTSFSAPSEPRK